MKDRQKKMLRLLLSQNDLFHLEDLAETFAIGKRTVSRDLDNIERWISLRGVQLERKPGQGIRVRTYEGTADELLELLNTPEGYIESLNPTIRKNLILLYLLYNNREIKIAEMASTFLISDTSVWNDLNLIEESLTRPTLSLHRHKGVGIQIRGEESQIRLEFLRLLTEIISAKTIIPYLYGLRTDSVNSLEMNQLRFFLEKLNFPSNRGILLKSLSITADELGYQFTMSGEAVLYFYLQMTLHRIKSGCLIEKDSPCSPELEKLAETVFPRIVERTFSGQLPRGEIKFLGLFMGVLETGTPPELRTLPVGLVKEKNIQDFTEKLISEFGWLDNHMYYLNDQVEAVLQITVSALVTRLRMGIPIWHGEWGDPEVSSGSEREKHRVLSELLKTYFGITAEKEDLDYLILYFQSLFFQEKTVPERTVRCLVCCFEGIGLASYLHSVLQKELDMLDVVESTAVFKIRQEYLETKNIELVLSTFPLSGITTPVIHISLPLDKAKLIEEVSRLLTRMSIAGRQEVRVPESRSSALDVPFEKIMDFIEDFSFLTMESTDEIDEIIEELAGRLTSDKRKKKQLAEDFRKREALGSWAFEEYETLVLHCKSVAINSPRAGIIDFPDESKNRMLFLVAPNPCPEGFRKLLSTITLSFMDNNRFRKALTQGGLSDMRRGLMDVYKEMV